MDLNNNGYGILKGVNSIVLSSCPLDIILAITVFNILNGLLVNSGSDSVGNVFDAVIDYDTLI
eukprot:CAMPEP_0116891594 /NCGR_PEP_ID=MMETSP0467-20121206/1964_1 /TAXON_ID=283647 /ORGANISM="Mesodinium pulex, Strain SPMC105" /LENGTH=62 /DNA_ID=CAMNT_0004560173 /DNA_START=341 /DNA_END=529 /DNA_ORIENTATION=+